MQHILERRLKMKAGYNPDVTHIILNSEFCLYAICSFELTLSHLIEGRLKGKDKYNPQMHISTQP